MRSYITRKAARPAQIARRKELCRLAAEPVKVVDVVVGMLVDDTVILWSH